MLVALAGPLARAPRALILDEPLAADAASQRPLLLEDFASGARPDGGRSFARLRGDGGALPAYPGICVDGVLESRRRRRARGMSRPQLRPRHVLGPPPSRPDCC